MPSSPSERVKAAPDIGGSRLPGPVWRRCLGVEAASERLIAVTVRGGRISSARTFSVTTPASSRPPIRALLGEGRTGGTPVHLVLCEPDHVPRTLLLPPMTAAERSEVVRRETSRDGDETKTVAWHSARRIAVDGLPQDEVLVVTASPSRLQQALEPFVRERIVPRVVTTGPLALIAAARGLTPTPLDRPTALVHWSVSTLTIVVVSDGVLKFARVIEPPAADLDPFDWIPVEIERSIRRHAVVSKGERVEHVMVSVAGAAGARRLFAGGELAERLRLMMTNLNALLAPQLPADAAGDMAAGVFTLAYGAAVLSAGEAPNLLPHALVVQRRSRQIISAAVAAGVVLALLLGSSAVWLTQRERDLRGRLSRSLAARQAAQARVDTAVRAEAERQHMREFARLLTGDPLHLLPPADALREFARLAPADLRLDELVMSLDGQGYVFSLSGRVDQDDFTEAQQSLNEFYYDLRSSPLFHSVEIQATLREDAPASTKEAERSATDGTGADAASASATNGKTARPLMFVVVAKLRRLS